MDAGNNKKHYKISLDKEKLQDHTQRYIAILTTSDNTHTIEIVVLQLSDVGESSRTINYETTIVHFHFFNILLPVFEMMNMILFHHENQFIPLTNNRINHSVIYRTNE